MSGNKWLWLFLLTVGLGACSPKVQPPAPVVKTETEKKPEIIKDTTKPVAQPPAKTSVVSLILPFALNNLNTGYSSAGLAQANIAIDFYQGFKLGLDSLTSYGYNYELHVFDSQGQTSQSHALAYNSQIRVSDLIVGPIFPEDMKAFASVLPSQRNPIVSPLSAAEPSTIKNQNLITVTPPLQYHAVASAKYATGKIGAKRIFILNSGYSADKEYTNYFKRAVDSLTRKGVQFTELTVSKGNLTAILPKLSATGQNVFFIPATNQQFLLVTLKALDDLSLKYPVTVFGHPNWEKFTFLKADQLQRLKTHITNSDRINYKAVATVTFMKAYRKKYQAEPSEYAIKGFDQAMYFGKLLAGNTTVRMEIEKTGYTGIHNKFKFKWLPGLGWVNTSVDVLTYANYELKRVE
ncbi:ABC transporter substrate-binding protein [Mucilaginibacter auburnensis]|uniref:ABC transporter substrate-binding protein n=1 Tax=Mucilaginibacter auburnensis TaxID=1457233 RepID=UPI001473B1B5|nr:ABC transporter substrate-binding protein [Mucilaginibacter auburnensis]